MFADLLGINVFIANFIVFAGLMLVCLLPLLIMGKAHSNVTFALSFILIAFGVAISWIPVWVFGIILLAIAFDTAKRLRRIFS